MFLFDWLVHWLSWKLMIAEALCRDFVFIKKIFFCCWASHLFIDYSPMNIYLDMLVLGLAQNKLEFKIVQPYCWFIWIGSGRTDWKRIESRAWPPPTATWTIGRLVVQGYRVWLYVRSVKEYNCYMVDIMCTMPSSY